MSGSSQLRLELCLEHALVEYESEKRAGNSDGWLTRKVARSEVILSGEQQVGRLEMSKRKVMAGVLFLATFWLAGSLQAGTGNRMPAYAVLRPSDSRIMACPTGRTLPKGQWYVADYELVLPHIAVGLTDRIMVWGGGTLPVGDDDFFPFEGFKVQLLRTKHVAAAGGWVGFGLSGLGFMVATLGPPSGSVTLGLSYDRSSEAHQQIGWVMGAAHDIGHDMQAMIELHSDERKRLGVIGLGLRFRRKRIALDLGWYFTPDLLDPSVRKVWFWGIFPWISIEFGGTPGTRTAKH